MVVLVVVVLVVVVVVVVVVVAAASMVAAIVYIVFMVYMVLVYPWYLGRREFVGCHHGGRGLSKLGKRGAGGGPEGVAAAIAIRQPGGGHQGATELLARAARIGPLAHAGFAHANFLNFFTSRAWPTPCLLRLSREEQTSKELLLRKARVQATTEP